ncbi:MAG: F0F1 ATP synthase subunit A [Bacteroidales bacterium]
MVKKYFPLILLLGCFFFLPHFSHAANEQEDQHHLISKKVEEEVQEEELEVGKMIIEHLVDSYEWHIAAIGETHISIPLPVIIYHNGELHCFLSSKFHHGESSYKGFRISSEGPTKGQIIKILEEDFIKGDIIMKEGSMDIPYDFSITKNVLALFISCLLLLWVFLSVAKAYKRREGQAPKGLQSLLEPVIIFVRDDIAISSIGEKKYRKYLPFLLTLFFFIVFNNLLGLIPFFPGGANVTGNIAVTMVLALFTFVITTFSGNKNYWKHIVNAPGVPWWLKFPFPLMPLVEVMGVFIKPFVLMVRLFANITAGHTVLLGFVSLIFIFGNINIGVGLGVSVISIVFMVFMTILELLVAFIQAYVFTLLSALYFGMATEEHH